MTHSSLPWSCKPWGDGSTPVGHTNIISVKNEVTIATDVIKEDAEFIVKCVNNQLSENTVRWSFAAITLNSVLFEIGSKERTDLINALEELIQLRKAMGF